MTTFAELGVPAEIVKVLAADGKSEAFPIQTDTLPATLDGGDVLGRSGAALAGEAAAQQERRAVL